MQAAALFTDSYSLDKAKRYEILRTVGRGAFGEVFLAWDTQFRRRESNSTDTNSNSGEHEEEDSNSSNSNSSRRAPAATAPAAKTPYHEGIKTRKQDIPSSHAGAETRVDDEKYRRDSGGFVALKSVACSSAGGGDAGWSERGGGGGGGGAVARRTLSKGLFRELRALQMLDCVHVVRLLDVYPEASNVVLVLEYMPSDLAKVLDYSASPLSEAHCKAYAIMLLKGLAFIHSHGLLHRDIKPSNLLLSAEGVLKIADFGQARTHTVSPTRSYSHQVATRWYRAPELLYGTRRYGFAVDLWAAGAIVGEMLASRPLFQGRSDIDQLHKILQVTGTPTEQSWPGAKDLPDFDKVYFADMEPQAPGVVFQGSSKEACDLAMGMLCLDPRGRRSAAESLRHRFFLVAPEPTPCRLLPRVSNEKDKGGDFSRRPRGAAFLDKEGWQAEGF